MIDLQELADMPGARRARDVLKKESRWHEEYTFQDVCDHLEGRTVIVFSGSKVLMNHSGEHAYEDIEGSLRAAMEAE